MTTDSLPPGGTVFDADELKARWAHAWRPEQVAERLQGVRAPWCVAAGWALDLFRGEQTGPHGDLEIAVPSTAFPEVRDRFTEYVWDAVGSGRVWAAADAETLAATHQTWLRDPAKRACGCRTTRSSSGPRMESLPGTGVGSVVQGTPGHPWSKRLRARGVGGPTDGPVRRPIP